MRRRESEREGGREQWTITRRSLLMNAKYSGKVFPKGTGSSLQSSMLQYIHYKE